jgi:hypothetical protein
MNFSSSTRERKGYKEVTQEDDDITAEAKDNTERAEELKRIEESVIEHEISKLTEEVSLLGSSGISVIFAPSNELNTVRSNMLDSTPYTTGMDTHYELGGITAATKTYKNTQSSTGSYQLFCANKTCSFYTKTLDRTKDVTRKYGHPKCLYCSSLCSVRCLHCNKFITYPNAARHPCAQKYGYTTFVREGGPQILSTKSDSIASILQNIENSKICKIQEFKEFKRISTDRKVELAFRRYSDRYVREITSRQFTTSTFPFSCEVIRSGIVWCMEYLEDNFIAVGGLNDLNICNISTGYSRVIYDLKRVSAIAKTDADHLLVSTHDNKLYKVNWRDGLILSSVQTRAEFYSLIVFGDNFEYVMPRQHNGTVAVYDLRIDGKSEVALFHAHPTLVHSIEILPNGRFATSGDDKNIRIWDIKSDVCLQTMSTDTSYSSRLCLMDANTLVSVDDMVKVWDLQELGRCIRKFKGSKNAFVARQLSPQFIAVGTGAGYQVYICDIHNEAITVMTGHTDSVKALAVTNNHKIVSGGCTDRSIRVWSSTNSTESNGFIGPVSHHLD